MKSTTGLSRGSQRLFILVTLAFIVANIGFFSGNRMLALVIVPCIPIVFLAVIYEFSRNVERSGRDQDTQGAQEGSGGEFPRSRDDIAPTAPTSGASESEAMIGREQESSVSMNARRDFMLVMNVAAVVLGIVSLVGRVLGIDWLAKVFAYSLPILGLALVGYHIFGVSVDKNKQN